MPPALRRGLRFFALIGLFGLAVSAAADPPGVEPGFRFEVRAADLPAPYTTPNTPNGPRQIGLPRGTSLTVPDGFRADVFADNLRHARWLTTAADGTVFVAESGPGDVTLLRDLDGDGVAEIRATFVSGLNFPHGLVARDGFLYVADVDGVRRYPYSLMRDEPTGPVERVTAPGAFGGTDGHRTRSLLFDSDRFYVTVGSAGNIGVEAAPRATVQVFDGDGGNQATFASGLRNAVGIDMQPDTGEIYVVVAERDGMGDELVPDFFTRIRAGEFFGWPYAYIGQNPQPGLGEQRPDLVAASLEPDVLFQSHSTPLGLIFYDGASFPAAYRGDAFVALHGSFNAAEPRGYMVVRIPFADGRPQGFYEAFATGFWVSGERKANVIGRPAGLAVAKDGSLLVADDGGNRVWRISYGG